jgi:PTH1 family peptidyl-tRNA hydrolase
MVPLGCHGLAVCGQGAVKAMKLLVGLGNPGDSYARQRHNVGFMALDAIAAEHRLPAWRRRFQGVTTEGEIGGVKCLLLKPTTYMNDSGRSVGEAVRFLKLGISEVIVIHDEIDLAPSRLKVKAGGGVAGHNGLRSLSAHIDNDYVRVRIGVGHPGSKEAVPHYVLHDFHKSEHLWLDPMLAAIAKAAGHLVNGKYDRFMSEVALLMQPDDERTSKRAGPAAAKPPRAATPVEPQAKPAGSMADTLKKWLAGRGRRDG